MNSTSTGDPRCRICHMDMTVCKCEPKPRIFEPPPASSPDDLWVRGWMVAVHNDYTVAGEQFTFWLFTRGNECVKGEGRTDEQALNEVRARLRRRDTSA